MVYCIESFTQETEGIRKPHYELDQERLFLQ